MLPRLEAFPVTTFVEVIALIFGELAIDTTPATASGNDETISIGSGLREHVENLSNIHLPGAVAGDDVLETGANQPAFLTPALLSVRLARSLF